MKQARVRMGDDRRVQGRGWHLSSKDIRNSEARVRKENKRVQRRGWHLSSQDIRNSEASKGEKERGTGEKMAAVFRGPRE